MLAAIFWFVEVACFSTLLPDLEDCKWDLNDFFSHCIFLTACLCLQESARFMTFNILAFLSLKWEAFSLFACGSLYKIHIHLLLIKITCTIALDLKDHGFYKHNLGLVNQTSVGISEHWIWFIIAPVWIKFVPFRNGIGKNKYFNASVLQK